MFLSYVKMLAKHANPLKGKSVNLFSLLVKLEIHMIVCVKKDIIKNQSGNVLIKIYSIRILKTKIT